MVEQLACLMALSAVAVKDLLMVSLMADSLEKRMAAWFV